MGVSLYLLFPGGAQQQPGDHGACAGELGWGRADQWGIWCRWGEP